MTTQSRISQNGFSALRFADRQIDSTHWKAFRTPCSRREMFIKTISVLFICLLNHMKNKEHLRGDRECNLKGVIGLSWANSTQINKTNNKATNTSMQTGCVICSLQKFCNQYSGKIFKLTTIASFLSHRQPRAHMHQSWVAPCFEKGLTTS